MKLKTFKMTLALVILGAFLFTSYEGGFALNNHWENLGGAADKSPSVTSWGADRKDVFVRSSIDQQIYWKFHNGANWSDWISIGGQATSAPDCVSPFPGRIDCVVRGEDNGAWHQTGVLTGNGMLWNGWASLGGILGSGPTISSIVFTDGHVELQAFVRGPGDSLWTKRNNGTSWGNWVEVPNSTFEGDPDCVYKGSGEVDCVVRGLDDTLRHNQGCCLNSGGATWENLGGFLLTGPTISSWGQDNLNVVVRGPGDSLWLRTWNGNNWTDWNNWDPDITMTTAADCTAPSPGNLFCVIIDANGNVLFDNLLVE